MLQARERVEQMKEEKKKQIEQKFAQLDEKTEKVRAVGSGWGPPLGSKPVDLVAGGLGPASRAPSPGPGGTSGFAGHGVPVAELRGPLCMDEWGGLL